MQTYFLGLALLLGSGLAMASDVDDFFGDTSIPEVLSATRLKQPKAETPASVTVIDADQIQAWGARSVSEVLRFVPGMFVGHSQSESSDTVVYHASSQNFMRRLQVLVDGRSVYKAAIARVVWDEVPVAIEDVQRIEIIRGPSSATYGANAFMATINIITKAPEDTLGTRVVYRQGNQGVEEGFLSHSALAGKGSLRLSTRYAADDGFDGRDNVQHGEDNWQDDSRNKFVNATYYRPLGTNAQLKFYASLGNSYAQMDQGEPRAPNYKEFRDTDFAVLHSQLEFDFSARHQSHLQIYWQREQRTHERHDLVPAVLFDPRLRALYQIKPQAVSGLLELLDAGAPGGQIMGFVGSNFTGAEQITVADLYSKSTQQVTGFIDYNYTDQRTDIEWQDTFIWSDTLRSVSGVSFRRDAVYAQSMLGGHRQNDLYRAFANVEWQLVEPLFLNLGGMYEYEELNGNAFSPRVALNWLTGTQQSVRLVYSQAIRSPDMLEQEPNMTLVGQNLSPSYLSSSYGPGNSLPYFMTNQAQRSLKHERIESYELGLYQALASANLEFDLKLYNERLRYLAAGAINLDTPVVKSNVSLDIRGAELQLKWQPLPADWFWLTLAHLDTSDGVGTRVETRLSPENSAVASWSHRGNQWSSTLSYFWLDSLANNRFLYQRSEWNLRKEWKVGRYNPWVGGFWQHQFARNSLGYYSQMYSTPNTYYLQVGLNF